MPKVPSAVVGAVAVVVALVVLGACSDEPTAVESTPRAATDEEAAVSLQPGTSIEVDDVPAGFDAVGSPALLDGSQSEIRLSGPDPAAEARTSQSQAGAKPAERVKVVQLFAPAGARGGAGDAPAAAGFTISVFRPDAVSGGVPIEALFPDGLTAGSISTVLGDQKRLQGVFVAYAYSEDLVAAFQGSGVTVEDAVAMLRSVRVTPDQ